MAAEAARLRDMHPSDVAGVVRSLPLAQRKQLAEAMDDERLADLLEELPEAEQLRIIEGLDLERLVNVLEEMEYDDLADLLGRDARRAAHPHPRRDGRRGRRRGAPAARATRRAPPAALMTPDIIILGPTATVAEALAEIRDPDWLVSIAAQVFVVPAAVQAADRHATSASSTSSGCCANRPAWSSVAASSRSRPSRPTCPSARSPSGWRATTCSPSVSATRPAGCSARSPSTTCSTARCRPVGANAGG